MKYSGATMNSPRSEGGFMSAPWRYMKKGNDDDDGATSNMKLPLVNDWNMMMLVMMMMMMINDKPH